MCSGRSRDVCEAVAHGPGLLQDVDGVHFHQESGPTLNGGAAQVDVKWLNKVGAVLQPVRRHRALSLHLALHQTPGVACENGMEGNIVDILVGGKIISKDPTALQAPLAVQMRLREINCFQYLSDYVHLRHQFVCSTVFTRSSGFCICLTIGLRFSVLMFVLAVGCWQSNEQRAGDVNSGGTSKELVPQVTLREQVQTTCAFNAFSCSTIFHYRGGK